MNRITSILSVFLLAHTAVTTAGAGVRTEAQPPPSLPQPDLQNADVRKQLLEKLQTVRNEAKASLDQATRDGAFEDLAVAAALAGNGDGARVICTGITDAEKRARALVAAAISQFKAGKTDAARETLDTAEHVAGRTNFIVADDVLIEVAAARAASGDAAGARKTIEDSTVRFRALSEIGKALMRRGDLAGARSCFDDALTAAGEAKSDWRSAEIKLTVEAWCEAGDVEGARQAVPRIEAGKSRDRANAVIAGALADKGDTAGIEVIRAQVTDSLAAEEVLAALARAEAKSGKFDRALASAGGVRQNRTWASTITEIAREMAKRDKKNEALAALRSIRQRIEKGSLDHDEQVLTLSEMAGVLSACGDAPGARASIAEAKGVAAKASSSVGKSNMLTCIALAEAGIAEYQSARATVLSIPETYHRLRALRPVATAEAKASGISAVLKWIDGLPSASERASALHGLALAL
ncbi:MAG: hypothetical protein WAZ94_04400 [Phycisphaerales bacterium]